MLNTEDPRHVDKALTEDEIIEFGMYGKNKKTDQKAIKNNVKMVGENIEID